MINNYITGRLDVQIKWYDDKSVRAQKHLFWTTIFSVICTSLIPIMTLFSDSFAFTSKLLITLLSQLVTICTWYINFNKLQEVRINYRCICELLKTNKVLFENKCSPYDNPDTATQTFITNCEAIMDEEHKNWSSTFKKKDK